MLQPLKAKNIRGISRITKTMNLVFKYWPCKKKKIKLGKKPTIVETAKMKHFWFWWSKISHQTTNFKGGFLQGLKVILPPLFITDALFGSYLQFSCPRLTVWGSLSGELVDLNNVLENLEAKRLDLKQRHKVTSARPITNLCNYYHVFARSQVEVEPRIQSFIKGSVPTPKMCLFLFMPGVFSSAQGITFFIRRQGSVSTFLFHFPQDLQVASMCPSVSFFWVICRWEVLSPYGHVRASFPG